MTYPMNSRSIGGQPCDQCSSGSSGIIEVPYLLQYHVCATHTDVPRNAVPKRDLKTTYYSISQMSRGVRLIVTVSAEYLLHLLNDMEFVIHEN